VNNWVVAGIIVGAVLIALVAGPYLAQGMVKGSSARGTGGFGIVDQLFHPVQADASAQIQTQQRRRQDAEDGDGDDDDPAPEQPGAGDVSPAESP
jgi:hypothetical protein